MDDNDREAEARGFETTAPGGWTPMFELFLGVLVLDALMKRADLVPGMPQEFFQNLCIDKSGAGLFLSAAKRLDNQRVFQTDGAGTMGIGALDIEVGDRVVLLRGAYAPVIVRRIQNRIAGYEGERWVIVCEAYVHAAMNKEERVYSEGLCKDWEQYMIW
jgi:hypothetical protein